MKTFIVVSTLFALVASASGAAAQNSYVQNITNSWRNRNTATGFTSDMMAYRTINRSVPQYAYSNVNRGLLSVAQSSRPTQKPFSSFNRSSGLTPYMGLLASNPFTSTTDNYFSVVRPQIEQQKINEQLQQRNLQLQRQLNDIALQASASPTGDKDRAPTGHVSVYMNYGGYYTPVQPRSVRPGGR
jgi:hypothetical protein